MSGQLRVGFCGLGRMGTEMVAALAENGHAVTVWNRSPIAAQTAARAHGVVVATTPAEAATGAHVVITMLTHGGAVLDTLTRSDGVLSGTTAGTVVVDCSTTGAEAASNAAAQCALVGVHFLDSPVSGSTVVARQGQLGLMVGGEQSVIDLVRPVLDALGTVVHVGPNGAGAAAKVAVNALLHTFNTALSECVVTARSAGVPTAALFDVLSVGVLWNRFLDYKRPSFTDPESTPVAFDLRTATKDLGLAVAAEEAAGLDASVVRTALDLHRQAVADGFGDRDMAELATWFADTAGHPAELAATGGNPPRRASERN